MLALNELRGVGQRDWMGLREFSQNRYPKLWTPVENYFPGGLVNSDGEPVTDLIEECVARDIHQQPCHAHWVECPDREHQCFYMDRNNPVWREYLKAVIRIQIDAGVDGIQLDEAELPMGAFQYGACFCKDCMKGFRAYLQALAAVEREHRACTTSTSTTFHYGDWLLGAGLRLQGRPRVDAAVRRLLPLPVPGDQEVLRRARRLRPRVRPRSVGREILVSGNFFNLEPMYLALADDVDLVITEMRNTTYRQPEWYRYVAAFAGDKDVVVVENPYGGVVPELIELLGRGQGPRPAPALAVRGGRVRRQHVGARTASWMGSIIEDSFYAPHELATEIQAFLADHERAVSRGAPPTRSAVVFSVESTRELIGRADASDNTDERARRVRRGALPRRDQHARRRRRAVRRRDLVPDGVTAPDRRRRRRAASATPPWCCRTATR